jgi:hypothetical protein
LRFLDAIVDLDFRRYFSTDAGHGGIAIQARFGGLFRPYATRAAHRLTIDQNPPTLNHHELARLARSKPMNLEDFIKTALIEIVAGVAGAQVEIRKQGADTGSIRNYGSGEGQRRDSKGREIHMVEFDIALADASTTDTRGGIGVFLGPVGLGSQGASHGDSSRTSRIKFSVPAHPRPRRQQALRERGFSSRQERPAQPALVLIRDVGPCPAAVRLALRDHQQLDAAAGFRALLLLGDVGLCHGATEA